MLSLSRLCNISSHQRYSLQKEIKKIESDETNYRFLAVCEFEKSLKEFGTLKLEDRGL